MNSKFFKLLIALSLLVAPALQAAKIGLLVMATGKYIDFVPSLVKSADVYFCKNHEVTFFVFTDGTADLPKNVVTIYQPRMGWPFDTMMRYHVYYLNQDEYEGCDYLYACDADMLFTGEVGDEILGERMATRHPGFYSKPRSAYTYDKNPLSKAYIAPNEGTDYYCGGFYGGTKEEFLKIVKTNADNVDADMENGIIALWHDESHWNRYCIDHPPTVVLSPSYCYPAGIYLPFPPKLVALNKDHEHYRSE